MKTCTKCATAKDETEYFIKDKKSGRLHTQCKLCYKEHRKTYQLEHYEKYKHLYRQRAQIQRKSIREKFRSNMLMYLKDKTCAICGEMDIRTFEFDHLEPSEKSSIYPKQ